MLGPARRAPRREARCRFVDTGHAHELLRRPRSYRQAVQRSVGPPDAVLRRHPGPCTRVGSPRLAGLRAPRTGAPDGAGDGARRRRPRRCPAARRRRVPDTGGRSTRCRRRSASVSTRTTRPATAPAPGQSTGSPACAAAAGRTTCVDPGQGTAGLESWQGTFTSAGRVRTGMEPCDEVRRSKIELNRTLLLDLCR
jgi:hypothetical protein